MKKIILSVAVVMSMGVSANTSEELDKSKLCASVDALANSTILICNEIEKLAPPARKVCDAIDKVMQDALDLCADNLEGKSLGYKICVE